MKTSRRMLAVLFAVVLATVVYAACNSVVGPTECASEVVRTCAGVTPPGASGIRASADCSSFVFDLLNPQSGYETASRERHWWGRYDCPPDEDLHPETVPLPPSIGWTIVAGTMTWSGTGTHATAPRPADACSAECTFTLTVSPSVCTPPDPVLFKATAFFTNAVAITGGGPRVCMTSDSHGPHRFPYSVSCDAGKSTLVTGSAVKVSDDGSTVIVRGTATGRAAMTVSAGCGSDMKPFDVVDFDGFRFEAGCGCDVDGGRETMSPAGTVRVTPKAAPESYDGECCWWETDFVDPVAKLSALEEEIAKVPDGFERVRTGTDTVVDPLLYGRVLIQGWFDCERNSTKDDGEPDGTNHVSFADLGILSASDDSGIGNRSASSEAFAPGTVVEFRNGFFRPADRAHVLSVVGTRAEDKDRTMDIPLGPLVATDLNVWRMKIPDDCPDGIFSVELRDPLHSCHTLTNTFCVQTCSCGSCEGFAKHAMENGCVKMTFGLGRLASGGRKAPLSFVLEDTSLLPDLSSVTVPDGSVAVSNAAGRMTLAFTRTGEQAPLAVYELISGASAFTVNETRNGFPRSSTVWRNDGGIWTMETYDLTSSPRVLIGRTVKSGSVSGSVKTVRLAEGGRVIEKDYTDIPGVGSRVTRETRGSGADAVTDWTSYVLTGAAAGKPSSELSSDGSWRIYAYDQEGRVVSETSPFGDTAPVVGNGHEVTGCTGTAKRTVSTYVSVDPRDDLSLSDTTPRTVVTSVGSDIDGWIETSRTYYAEFIEDGFRVVVSERAAAPGAAFGANGNLRATTVCHWRDEHAGLPAERIAEDGLVTRYSYAFAADGGRVTESFTSPVDVPGGVPFKTVISRTVENAKGDTVAEEQWLVTDADRILLSRTEYELDAAGHVLRSSSTDGSVVERTWGCCGPESERDASGVVTEFVYDAAGREMLRVRNGVTTGTFYDLAGNATNAVRIGTAVGSLALTVSASSGYDSAGRLAWRVGEDGVRTEYRYGVSPEGGETRTTIRAAGTDCAVTNTTVSFRGGTVKATYLNGVLKTTETREPFAETVYEGSRGVSSPRWTRTETDFLGRTVSESRPGYGGSTLVTSNAYDTAGRVIATREYSVDSGSSPLAFTCYAYDESGELMMSVSDRNFNGAIDWTGPDLIQSNAMRYVKLDNSWWRESRRWSVHRDGSAEPQLVATSRARVTGLGEAQTVPSAPSRTGDGEAILCSESVSIDLRGNATTNRLFRNRASAEDIAWVKYPTSTTPAVTVSTNGLACSSTSQTGVTTTFAYDAFQREVSQTDGRGNTTHTVYDNLGRVTSTIDALGYATDYGYDALGRQISVTDPLTNTVYTAYDSEGHVVSQRGATYPVDYAYDEFGDKISMTTYRNINVAGDVTRWLRDEATGLVTNKVYADGKGPRYAYTPDGKLATRTWARGIVTTYSCDDNGALTNTVYSDGTPTISLAYNRAGRQVQAIDAAGVTTFLYDAFGAVTNETVVGVAGTNTIIRHWDNYGRSLAYALNGVRQSTLGYDTVGRIVAVRQDNVDVVYAYADDGCEAGWMVSDVSGFSVSREVYRHPYRREHVMAITNRINGIVHSHYEFAYDDSGRLIRRNDDAFAYNGRSEIASAAIGADSYAYRYDSIGNNVWTALNLSTNVYAANAVNAYVSVGDGAVAREPTYDADGNMTFDGERTHVYDAENRLVSVSANGVTLQANFYDHQGRRVRKVTADAEHVFIYDGWNLAKEIVVSFGVTNTIEYLWGRDLSDSLQGAGGVGGLVAVKRNGALYVPLYDQNGNVTDYVGSSGSVVAHYEYDAFGNTINQSGTMADVFAHRFSTKYYDAETGLYYYGYRFYSPRLMRWINRDPVAESGGVNVYEFCQNRSTVLFDPKGLTTVRIKVGTEEKDSPRGFLNFIKIDAIVIEPPKEPGKLNFVQLKKSANSDWELDIQGTPGPYYYKLFDVWKNTRKNEDGRDVVTLYDAPGGFSDKVDFYTAVVEVNRTCRAGKHQIGFPIINCYDRVKVVASVSWSFDPYTSGGYQYSGKTDGVIKRGAMIPTLQQLINKTTWSTELCSTTKVEVQNER